MTKNPYFDGNEISWFYQISDKRTPKGLPTLTSAVSSHIRMFDNVKKRIDADNDVFVALDEFNFKGHYRLSRITRTPPVERRPRYNKLDGWNDIAARMGDNMVRVEYLTKNGPYHQPYVQQLCSLRFHILKPEQLLDSCVCRFGYTIKRASIVVSEGSNVPYVQVTQIYELNGKIYLEGYSVLEDGSLDRPITVMPLASTTLACEDIHRTVMMHRLSTE